MKFRISFFLLLIIFHIPSYASAGSLAVYSRYSGNPFTDRVLYSTERQIIELFSKSGRFYPAGFHERDRALKKFSAEPGYDMYIKAAGDIRADLLLVLDIYWQAGIFHLKISAFDPAGKDEYGLWETVITTSIPENVPLKGALACSRIVKNLKLKTEIIYRDSSGRAEIFAGEWNGLRPGRYRTDSGAVEVVETGRYSAVIEGAIPEEGEAITFNIIPDIKDYLDEIEKNMRSNIVKKYGTDEKLNRRRGSAKEMVYGTCIINPGASLFLPGYGSFLAVEYMGIENGEPDYRGIFAGVTLTAGHFFLPAILTGFKTNFFPWVQDGDKTDEMKRLHIFLWAAIPVTYTVTFYDQLAHQYQRKDLLPPMFVQADNTAAFLSLLIPGGGLFYKGYRGAGWCFYASEMSLLGYGIYTGDKVHRRAAFAGFAAVKVLDVVSAYLLKPSYPVYRDEFSGDMKLPVFSADIRPCFDGGSEFLLSATLFF